MRSPRNWVPVATVAIAITPLVVATVRALSRGWIAIGDNGLILLRAEDVATANHPLLGTWTSASLTAGRNINNPGPLWFDVLAPFVRIGGPERRLGRRGHGRQHRRHRRRGVGGAADRRRPGPGPRHRPVRRSGLGDGERVALRRVAAPRADPAVLGAARDELGVGGRGSLDEPVRRRHRQPARPDPPHLRLRPRWWSSRRASPWPRRASHGGRPATSDGRRASSRRCGTSVCGRLGGRCGRVGQPLIDQFAGEGNLADLVSSGGGDTDRIGLGLGTRFVASVVALPPWWTRPGFSSTIRATGVVDDAGSRTVAEGDIAGTGLAVLGLLAVVAMLGVVIVVGVAPSMRSGRRPRSTRRRRRRRAR